RPAVDLPQPDSPTRPSVSPRITSKLTPSTAFTAPTCRCTMKPELMGKCFFISRTRRIPSLPSPFFLRVSSTCAITITPIPPCCGQWWDVPYHQPLVLSSILRASHTMPQHSVPGHHP